MTITEDDVHFGNSVAVVGKVAVVGAPEVDDGTIEKSGAVFVFTRDPSTETWTQAADLRANDAAQDDLFGHSVGFDGETIVIGAPGDDSAKGAAYVFIWDDKGTPDLSDDAWSQTAKLTASDAAISDLFGRSVAIDGDTIVVGAYAHK